jgi:hypothetical protein
MSEITELDNISDRGWTPAEFAVSESDRAEYARAANAVISLALDNEAVKQALGFELNPGLEKGSVRTGQFGIGYPRNSDDEKVYLHTGYQSCQIVDIRMPVRNQPLALRSFWDINEVMLDAIEARTRSMLMTIGAVALEDIIFPEDFMRRDVHLRTVRYIGGLNEPVGEEVVSGHADLGLMSWHLYETHGGWLWGAPYAPKTISAKDSPKRRKEINLMREYMRPLDQTEDTLPFFLGANWHTFHDVPKDLRSLPACYHAGFRPIPEHEIVSADADRVIDGRPDRVSVISFIHPNGDELLLDRYVPATVPQCRPKY